MLAQKEGSHIGFWGKLAKGLAIGGAGLATVMTAGAASPAIAGALGMSAGTAGAIGAGAGAASKILGAVGGAASGAADAAAANRGEETRTLLTRDSLGMQAARDFENAQQNRAKLQLDQQDAARTSETDAYKKALKSALAMHMQDVSVNRPDGVPMIRFSGGARPSAIGPEGREAAALLNNKALQRLMGDGDPRMELAPLEKYRMADAPRPGFAERVAGPAGLILSAGSEILPLLNQPRQGPSIANRAAQLAGVTPFTAPPKARLMPVDDEDAFVDNR